MKIFPNSLMIYGISVLNSINEYKFEKWYKRKRENFNYKNVVLTLYYLNYNEESILKVWNYLEN